MEKQPVEPLPPAKVYIKKPDQVLVPQVTATGTGSAALEEPKVKKRDQELVPPERPSVSVSDVPPPMKPAAELDTEPQPTSETIIPASDTTPAVVELDGSWHGIPLFCIFLSENHEPQMFYKKEDAIACAMRLIATEFSVTICKIAPWRKVETMCKIRIEPAQKRKRKV